MLLPSTLNSSMLTQLLNDSGMLVRRLYLYEPEIHTHTDIHRHTHTHTHTDWLSNIHDGNDEEFAICKLEADKWQSPNLLFITESQGPKCKLAKILSTFLNFIHLFVLSRVAIDCWQSFDVPSAYRQRWGLGLAQCASPLTLGLVLYIYRAQRSQRVSLAGCQSAALLYTVSYTHLTLPTILRV